MTKRLLTVRGDLRTVGVPQNRLAPARVCVTNDDVQFFQMSGKNGSSWLQIPDKYESTDFGLMKKVWKVM